MINKTETDMFFTDRKLENGTTIRFTKVTNPSKIFTGVIKSVRAYRMASNIPYSYNVEYTTVWPGSNREVVAMTAVEAKHILTVSEQIVKL